MKKRSQREPFVLPSGLQLNRKQKMDGLVMLKKIGNNCIPLVFFDPQYRGSLDQQKYGNEGARMKRRFGLPQMNDRLINDFFQEIERILTPGGHVMLWVDKYILLNTWKTLVKGTDLQLVDMIVWNKGRMGMGYRSRRCCEYLMIFQKPPKRVKGVWKLHDIPDVWNEKVNTKTHPHIKPIGLQKRIVESITNQGDIVVDPCAGSYSLRELSNELKRVFIGCDIN